MQAHDATRALAIVGGVIGLALFYQPWVSGNVSNVGPVSISGLGLAQEIAREMSDAASISPVTRPGAAPAAPGQAVAVGGLVLPTRIPTVAPGASGAGAAGAAAPAVSGLVLPTRIPTAVPAAPVAPAAGGDLVLPTRQPAGVVIATQAAATAQAAQTAQAGVPLGVAAQSSGVRPGSIADDPPQLPALTLYSVPFAGAGIAIFGAIYGWMGDPKDRRNARLWTVLFAVIGALATANVSFVVATAPKANVLLGAGEATGVLWALWASIAAFTVAGISFFATWTMARRAAA